MNPFGLFDAVVTAVELVLHTSRRKSGKESRRNRVLFWFAYGFLLAAGIGAAVWVIRSLYF